MAETSDIHALLARLPKIGTPLRPNRAGTELDPIAVVKAIATIGLKQPLTITWAGGTRRYGAHRWRDGQHVITLSTYRYPDETSRTLWHELAHALQSERLGEAEFNRQYRGWRYDENPFEIEANKFKDFHDVLPLATYAS